MIQNRIAVHPLAVFVGVPAGYTLTLLLVFFADANDCDTDEIPDPITCAWLLTAAAAQDMVRIEGGWATFGTSFADEDVPKVFAPKDEEGEQLAVLSGAVSASGGSSLFSASDDAFSLPLADVSGGAFFDFGT